MPRPQKQRQIGRDPGVSYFKPRGVPLRILKEVGLTVDEYEAVRLADLMGMSHEAAGQCMGVSRATFGRILQKARRNIARALINGMAIRIEGGNYQYTPSDQMAFTCCSCGNHWEAGKPNEDPVVCPQCRDRTVSPPHATAVDNDENNKE